MCIFCNPGLCGEPFRNLDLVPARSRGYCWGVRVLSGLVLLNFVVHFLEGLFYGAKSGFQLTICFNVLQWFYQWIKVALDVKLVAASVKESVKMHKQLFMNGFVSQRVVLVANKPNLKIR